MHGNGARRLRRTVLGLIGCGLMLGALTACAGDQATASLPEITKPTTKPLTPDQQKAAVQELTRQRDAQQAEAERQSTKPR